MARFLHVADIHLGFDRYDNRVRGQDFFKAFYNLLEIYAVGERVDFVVIAGDLFEHRNIQPATLNQAQICLNLLKDAHIPVIAIEGNHDNRPYGTKTSWLRYLTTWGSLIFLEPDTQDDGSIVLSAWNKEERFGGYIDLECGIRIIGTHWYGAVAPQVIEHIASAITALPTWSGQTVALLHHGLEGHVSRYAGALRYEELLPLKQAGVDYLALGHIHKSYSVEHWIFNPGSIEANSIEESKYERGAYLVELKPHTLNARLCTGYYQRSIVRLHLKVKGHEVPEAISAAALKLVKKAIATQKIQPLDEPIVELRITGRIGFERADLDTRALQQMLQDESHALIFLLRYDVDTIHYQSPLTEAENQLDIETDVYADLIAGHARYGQHTHHLSKALCQLKDLHMQEESDTDLYQFVNQFLQDVTHEAG
ncbi:DNA repair exonuclease [Okeania sp. SIO2G5]|uniref:metallophosphoesterase family protein n=1 Tax=Okeania sp. SIO2G5 TaxID=2607796 RepID=UPI0013C0FBCE|nr:DNA repair exonuclease [Okeania sp. SIO2G5]NEP76171.1 DNA repair exonuclease [Okeania sp. SIO2G5]